MKKRRLWDEKEGEWDSDEYERRKGGRIIEKYVCCDCGTRKERRGFIWCYDYHKTCSDCLKEIGEYKNITIEIGFVDYLKYEHCTKCKQNKKDNNKKKYDELLKNDFVRDLIKHGIYDKYKFYNEFCSQKRVKYTNNEKVDHMINIIDNSIFKKNMKESQKFNCDLIFNFEK